MVTAVQRWMFGGREYYHPLFRWLVIPATRLAVLLALFLSLIDSHHLRWLRWIGLGLLVTSAIADVLNEILIRRRRREHPSQIAGEHHSAEQNETP